MILIAGIPGETPVAMAIEAARDWGVDHLVLDQQAYREWGLDLVPDADCGWRGALTPPGAEPVPPAAISGIYTRMMDHRHLPETGGEGTGPDGRCDAFHGLFHAWLDLFQGRVANRPRAMMSNMSKSYQAEIIRRSGFAIPETLITNDPDEVLAFVAGCAEDGDEVVYKSVSGARSIVQTFSNEDRARLARIRWCPTQFQRKVRGTDYRVHVVGNRTFATRIESDATDYRYAHRQSGEAATLQDAELPEPVAEACVALAAALDLPFTGIDLRRTPGGEFVCFEANPSPAYSYYEDQTGVPISRALVQWLAGDDRAA